MTRSYRVAYAIALLVSRLSALTVLGEDHRQTCASTGGCNSVEEDDHTALMQSVALSAAGTVRVTTYPAPTAHPSVELYAQTHGLTHAHINHKITSDEAAWHSVDPKCGFNDQWYGLFIDGKDAGGGANAYGENYVRDISKPWDSVQSRTSSPSGQQNAIDLDYVLTLHKMFAPNILMRSSGTHVMYELPACFQGMKSNSLKKEILADLPQDVIDVERHGDGSIILIKTKDFDSTQVKSHLQQMIDKYNRDVRTANEPLQQLTHLAVFLRALAWLHPFEDGNGRIRTLLLQHELRRLALGCGSMMFNNNANIYFDTTETFVRKILEGRDAADAALASKRPPWDQGRKQAHLEAFPVPEGMLSCIAKFAEATKSIKLLQDNSTR